jgi:hypothetical protein
VGVATKLRLSFPGEIVPGKPLAGKVPGMVERVEEIKLSQLPGPGNSLVGLKIQRPCLSEPATFQGHRFRASYQSMLVRLSNFSSFAVVDIFYLLTSDQARINKFPPNLH